MKKTFVAFLVLAACGKGGDKASSSAPPVKIDPAAANALVPAELKEKIVFEQRDIQEERGKDSMTTYTLAAPKGWEQSGKMFAKLRPKDDLGFMTSFDVGTNCDGTCEPKDWAATSDKVNFKQFADGKIVKDEKTDTSRLLIAEKGGSTYVVYAWWTKGARKYATCTASLEAPAAPAAAAFAEACKAVNIKGDN